MHPVDKSDTSPTTSSDPIDGMGAATVDAPSIEKNGQLDLEARSVKTVAQANNICKAIEQNNQARAARTAELQALHDGQPPNSAAANAEKGKSWKSNFSTLWIAGVSGRVTQRFINAIVSQLTVTQSRLPEKIENAKAKSDIMQMKFTKLVRSWSGYTGLINVVATETVYQGYAYVTFLDPYTYKPTFIKQDRCFVPEGSGQHARDLQVIVARMDYRLDEFLDLFAWDEKHAEEVGYDIENCIFAANSAQVQDMRQDATTTQYRALVEMINEGVIGITYTAAGARVVNCYLLFNREYDGKVSFWIIHRDSGKKLRFSFKLFPKMEDVCALFSFEPGNGCIHSSKGIGRKLGALSIAKEMFRNDIVDNVRMASMLVLQADSKDKSRAAPAIMSPFIMLDKSITIPQQQFPVPSEGSARVDQATDGWAEQATGAYVTNPIYDQDSTEKTATQASIEAKQTAETADIQIRRYLDQWANMTQIQQLRAFSDDNIKEARRLFKDLEKDPEKFTAEFFEKHEEADALRTLVEIMQANISDDEIKMWRKSPASIYAHMQDTAVQAGVATVAQLYAGNPNVDQKALLKRNIEGIVGPELAELFVVPGIDQTVEIEASRQQIEESFTMYGTGIAIPVSPRDNHLVHATVLQQALNSVGKQVLENWGAAKPQDQKGVELNLNHMGSHLEAAKQLGMDKTPEFKALADFFEAFKKDVEQVVQVNQEIATSTEFAQQKIQQEGLPPAEGEPSLGDADPALGIPAAVGLGARAINQAEAVA